MSIGDSIRALRVKMGLTQKQLGEAIGIAEQSIYRYENGLSHPTFRILSKLEKFFGVRFGYSGETDLQVSNVLNERTIDELNLPKNQKVRAYYNLEDRKDSIITWIKKLDYSQFNRVEQLLDLAGMYSLSADDPSDGISNISEGRITVPVVGRAAAGLPIEMIETPEDDVLADTRRGDFAVIADGDSMIDAGIRDGDLCIIRPQPTVENGEIALVSVDDGSTIKRFYKDDDSVRLVPCNPSDRTQLYDSHTEIRVLGKFIKTV
mgnify:CR=1 FL=1